MARAKELFGDTCTVTRYPFDFSCAVKRFLQRVKPTIVGLVELEVWPNFVSRCTKNNVPIVIVNGRLSERSFKRYRIVKCILASTFRKITAIGMQNETYAQRVRSLGAQNVSVQGTMKWDNAEILESVPEDKELQQQLHIDPSKLLIVAGSTTPEEHDLLSKIIPEDVQLLCAPRRPEWFDSCAKKFEPCNRRTSSTRVETNRFVLDTIGELDKAYSLADIVIIGRSFVPMHGSDPSTSIALGKPTIIGTNASDFSEMVEVLLQGNGIIQCTADALQDHVTTLLQDENKRFELSTAGRAVIKEQQGATARYESLIQEHTPNA